MNRLIRELRSLCIFRSFAARLRRRVATAVAGGLILLTPARENLFAQDAEPQYRVETWRTENGLPQNTVKAITQTHDGYLWFGTRFGIVRFDGVRFRVFDRFNTDGLSQDNCIAITEETNGRLWFASPQGVVRYEKGIFSSFRLNLHKDADTVFSICTSRDGGVWVGAADGLKRFQNEKTTRYSTGDGPGTNAVHFLLEDPDGTLWVGSQDGLERRDSETGRFTHVWPPEDAPVGPARAKWVLAIHKDRAGNLWIGTQGSGLLRWKGGQWTSFTTKDGLPSNEVAFVTSDREGNLWVVAGTGDLLRLRNKRFAPFGRMEGLSKDAVWCLMEDREDNLWVGTLFGGLKRMQPRRILAYSTREGLNNGNVWSISEHRSGGLWVGTDGGVSLFENGRFTPEPLEKGQTNTVVKSVMEDRAGDLWIGTFHDGLKRMHNGTVTSFTDTNEPLHNQINALYQDREGAVWIGTAGGLRRFQNGASTRYGIRDGLTTNDVRAIHEDREGTIWIGTYVGGVNRFRDGHFTAITKRDGLSDNYAWCFYEERDGTLWIGTEYGLNRLKKGRLARFTKEQGLFDNVVNDVFEDNRGNLWISCNRGIYRVAKAKLNAVAEGGATTVDYVAFGASDGMLSSETNGEIQPAAHKTRDGKLWFPTTAGIVVIDPENITLNDLQPPVVLEDIIIDNESFGTHVPIHLEPGRGKVLEIQYTANSLVAPEKVRFKYCLDDFNGAWTDAETRRVAYYTNLSPGNHTFRVIACNNHGVWNTRGAGFSFYLAPYFYQTWPFYVACGAVVILAGFGLHRFRLRVVHKIEQLDKERALERERARIAGEMHDDLGSSLTQISLLSELAQRELTDSARAGDHIQNIARTTREVFRAMDEIVWAVNPRHDKVTSLVAYLSKYAQDYLRPAGIRCRFDLPELLPAYPLAADQRHNLFLTFKEALNNIVKHAAASEVWLRVMMDADCCRIIIEDNGRGFAIDKTRPGGNGMLNMRERLAAIGGELHVASEPGLGTRLELTIRLKQVGNLG